MSNDKTEFSEYKIQIGTEDLIESKVLPLIAEDPDVGGADFSKKAQKKLLEVLKETRVCLHGYTVFMKQPPSYQEKVIPSMTTKQNAYWLMTRKPRPFV